MISQTDEKRIQLLNGTWRHDATSSGKEVRASIRPLGSNMSALVFTDTFRNIIEYEILFSYSTPVAMATFDYGVKLYKTTYKFSSTTSRHINKWFDIWLDYYADDPEERSELLENIYEVPQQVIEDLCVIGGNQNG